MLATLIPAKYTAQEKQLADLKLAVTKVMRLMESIVVTVSPLKQEDSCTGDIALISYLHTLFVRSQLLYRWEGSNPATAMQPLGVTKREVNEANDVGGVVAPAEVAVALWMPTNLVQCHF